MRSGRVIRLVFLLLVVWPVTGRHADAADERIRVRLFELEAPRSIELRAVGGPVSFFTEGGATPVAELPPGEAVNVVLSGDEVRAAFRSGGVTARGLEARATEGRALQAVRVDDHAPTLRRAYEGTLFVRSDPKRNQQLLVINEVGLEKYVAGVLTSVYDQDTLEGAKAVAVAVRTYALRSSGRFGAAYDQVDHMGSQVYRGTGRLDPLAVRAQQATRGQVLTYREDLIEAVYFASSGGHTADNENVWSSEPRPYLRGRPDPFDAHPELSWRLAIPSEQLLRILSDHYQLTVEGFLIEERSKEGRVRSLALLLPDDQKRYILGTAFRDVVNRGLGDHVLNSTNFTALRLESDYLFEGVGFGHGVGLPWWGAHGMAKRGRDYREILSYYYTDARVRQVQNVRPSADSAAQPALPVDRTYELPALTKLPSFDADHDTGTAATKPRPIPTPDAPARRVDPEPTIEGAPASDSGERIGW